MLIDNKLNTARFHLYYNMMIFICLFCVALALVFGLNTLDGQITIGFSVVFFIGYLIILGINPFYLSTAFQNDLLVIRYFNAHPWLKKPQMMQIPYIQYANYEIISKNMGLHSVLILYQRLPEGVAKYPPISLGAFSSEQKEMLIKSLNNLAKR